MKDRPLCIADLLATNPQKSALFGGRSRGACQVQEPLPEGFDL